MHFLLKFKLKVLLGSLLPRIPTTTALDPYQLLPQLWKELPWRFALLPCIEAPLNGPGEVGEWAPPSSLCDGEPVGVQANSRIASAHFLFSSSATPCLWLFPFLPTSTPIPASLPSGPPLRVNPLPSALWTEVPVWKLLALTCTSPDTVGFDSSDCRDHSPPVLTWALAFSSCPPNRGGGPVTRFPNAIHISISPPCAVHKTQLSP